MKSDVLIYLIPVSNIQRIKTQLNLSQVQVTKRHQQKNITNHLEDLRDYTITCNGNC